MSKNRFNGGGRGLSSVFSRFFVSCLRGRVQELLDVCYGPVIEGYEVIDV